MSHILEHSIVESADALLILFRWTGIPLPPMRAQSNDLRTVCVSAFILQTCWNEVTLRYSSFCFTPSSRFNFRGSDLRKIGLMMLNKGNQDVNNLFASSRRPSVFVLFSYFSSLYLTVSAPCLHFLLSVSVRLSRSYHRI